MGQQVNPWDFWLSTLVEEERLYQIGFFENDETRSNWRTFMDIASDQYQRAYRSFQKTPKSNSAAILTDRMVWFRSFVSQNEDTWSYLENLQHPLDIGEE